MINASGEGPILVFLGPTLPLADAQAILDAIYLQPATQGDVLLAAHAFRPKAMVLIDGQFEDRPAVRQKEILWAMAQGIVMIGAASMGALRAAELNKFGMLGVGLIYRWYRRWPLASDDAVAVQSGPAELGFIPLTDAMIDLQASFSRLLHNKVITLEDRNRLTSTARRMNFRERSIETVLRAAGWPPDGITKVRKGVVQQKRLDALQALRTAPRLARSNHSSQFDWSWTATNTFLRDLEAGGVDINLLTTYR